jgi:hypothetical protein
MMPISGILIKVGCLTFNKKFYKLNSSNSRL